MQALCILIILADTDSVAGEKTRRTKAKEAFSVTFDESVDLEWSFKCTRAATTVTKMTLEKHSKQQTTLPQDLHYDANQLMKLSTMPPVMASVPVMFYCYGPRLARPECIHYGCY